ncbi:MAG: sulfatase-like hydrolase/transferase, partial [Kiritimatiellales bacterium]|nr:sulfatase-like hydrolase/transferase [Kiritimatiellales bacterium]
MRRVKKSTVLTGWALAALFGLLIGSWASQPNIIFILCDDLGYGDLGILFQNNRVPGLPKHATPQLDSMAAAGIQLRSHYCPAPVCAPSRASVLGGVHQGHATVRDNQFEKALEDNHTIATVLRTAGYATAAFGKYGLKGDPLTVVPDWEAHPLQRGFDYYYGYITHADGHRHYPKEDGKPVYENYSEVSVDLDLCYTTDLFTARAKQWMIDHLASPDAGKPMFLYLAYDTPHAILQYPPSAFPAGGGLSGG